MTESPAMTMLAWHPFTPRGVAGAARAPRWQLWLVLGTTAGLAVATLLNFLTRCWTPVIVEAISQLKDGGVIRNGILHPGGDTDLTLASNQHLSITLNWSPSAPRDQASDVRVFLEIDHALVCSLFGCMPFSYEHFGDAPLGRTETGAWWQAWSPTFYTAAAIGYAVFLIVSWWCLVVLYAWPVRLLAFYLDRQVDFAGAARVAQAALVPGALWMSGALFGYARGWLGLVGLLIVFVLHLPVGWLFAGLACRHLPLRSDTQPANPFQSGSTQSASSDRADP